MLNIRYNIHLLYLPVDSATLNHPTYVIRPKSKNTSLNELVSHLYTLTLDTLTVIRLDSMDRQ